MAIAGDRAPGEPSPRRDGPGERKGWSRGARDVVLWGAAAPAIFYALERVPGPGPVEVDAFIGFSLGLVPVAGLTWLVARSGTGTRAALVWIAVGLAGALGLSAVGQLVPAVPFKVVLAAVLGRLLGRQAGEPLWLAVVAVVALLADAWSVFAGPTRAVVEQAPGFLDYLLVHFPVLGRSGTGMGLGLSDVVFLALFAAGSAQAGLRVRGGFTAMCGSLLVTVAVALAWKPALPALPLLSVAFLAVNADLLVGAVRGLRRA